MVERRVRLLVEYDGTDFVGWQRQDNGPSVQEHLETAVSSIVGEPTTVHGASRTDAGVHARGQVAVFSTDKDIPLEGFRRGINSRVPAAIAVIETEEAAADFHPRFASQGKWYRYTLYCQRSRSPLALRTSWHRPRPLDLERMRAAAPALVGEHDFSAFRATGCTANTATRRIDAIDITVDDAFVYIDVRGNAFLRNMVRIIAGTLVDCAEGRIEPDALAGILADRRREAAGVTAPAHGLCLMHVSFDGPP